MLSSGYELGPTGNENLFDLEGAASLYIVSGHWPTNIKRQLLLIYRIINFVIILSPT